MTAVATHPGMAALEAAIADLGYKRRKAGLFTRELADDVLGWLGLNTATRSQPAGHVLVNPVIGVRFQKIEELVAEGRGEKAHRYTPPTLSTTLVKVTPGSSSTNWVLTGDENHNATVIESINDALSTTGAAFMNEHAALEALLPTFERTCANDQSAAYRWPLALRLLGRPDDARAAIKQVRESLGSRDDLAANEQRAFLDWAEKTTAAA